MPLKLKIQDALKSALKEKREIELSVLRMVSAAISNGEIAKRTKAWKERPDLSAEELAKESRLTDEEINKIIASEIKKRKEAVDLYEKGNRMELAGKENKEIEILQSYLPEQLSEEEIRNIVKSIIEKTGAKEIRDMGMVMKELMPEIKDRADNNLASRIVKELLG